MSAGVSRSVLVWIAACLWLAPSANCNIYPHYHAGEVGETINQTLFVLAMASLPIIARRTSAHAIKVGLYALGLCLFAWSIYNALHMGWAAQETATQGPRATLARANAYKAQIASLEDEKGRITSKLSYEYMGEGAVAEAQSSLRLAVEAAAAECRTGRGDKCLKREGEVETLRKASEKAAAARDDTKRVEDIEGDIRRERQKISDLGPIPETGDHAAALIASGTSMLPSVHISEDAVSALLLFLYALGVEGMAFIGPGATIDAFSPKEGDSNIALPHISLSRLPKRGEAEVMTPDRPLPLPRRATRKKVEEGDKAVEVREWLKSRTVDTPGHLLSCKGDAYADYARWSRSKGVATLELASFGTAMKEIGVGKVKRSGYLYYTGIALKRQPALQIVSG